MSNPYTPPEGDLNAPTAPGLKHVGRNAPLKGCVTGGCLVPVLLFIACAVFLKDTGGPLIWPIFSVLFGGFGLIAGFIYRASKNY